MVMMNELQYSIVFVVFSVWEKQDHMSPEDFDPKTFFMMHGTLILSSIHKSPLFF